MEIMKKYCLITVFLFASLLIGIMLISAAAAFVLGTITIFVEPSTDTLKLFAIAIFSGFICAATIDFLVKLLDRGL